MSHPIHVHQTDSAGIACSYGCGMYTGAPPHDTQRIVDAAVDDALVGAYNPCAFWDELDQITYDRAWREAQGHRPGVPVFVHQAQNLTWQERRQLSVGMIVVKGRRR